MLNWNADIDDSNFLNHSLSNLNLTLSKSSDPNSPVIDFSASAVDNLEHIYIGEGQTTTFLDPGTYLLQVEGDPSITQDYGLAWRMTTAYGTDPNNLSPTADFDGSGTVDGVDFLAWQANVGTLFDATLADGDADGDGDVDQMDLSILESQYGNTSVLPTIIGVPEPGTLMLTVLAAMGALLPGRRIKRTL